MSEQFIIPTIGDLIAGKYQLVEELGRGAYGIVFLAEQPEIGRKVALKTLLPQAFLQTDIVDRFHREAQLISRLDHPNIIRLYDYGIDEGLLYMAVEYAEGRTLAELVALGPTEYEPTLRIAEEILAALDAAHASGIVHRDLKPENIVLDTGENQDRPVVKVLDFGIAKLVRGEKEQNALKSLTQDGTVLGTPHYMSPENIAGDPVDHRADLYALGVIIHEMLSGKHPFHGPNPSAVLVNHISKPPPDLPQHYQNTALGALTIRCLEKQPEDRIANAAEALAFLRDFEPVDPQEFLEARKAQEAELATEVPPATTSVDKERAKEPLPVAAYLSIAGIVLVLILSIGAKIWYTFYSEDSPLVHTTLAEDPSTDPSAAESISSAPLEVMEFDDEVNEQGHPSDADELLEDPGDAENDLERVEPDAEPSPALAEEANTGRPVENRPPRVREKPSATVRIKIESQPPSAQVMVNGRPVGNTPTSVDLERGDEKATIRVSHIGYRTESRQVALDRSQNIEIVMERERLQIINP